MRAVFLYKSRRTARAHVSVWDCHFNCERSASMLGWFCILSARFELARARSSISRTDARARAVHYIECIAYCIYCVRGFDCWFSGDNICAMRIIETIFRRGWVGINVCGDTAHMWWGFWWIWYETASLIKCVHFGWSWLVIKIWFIALGQAYWCLESL